jgi:hypothetical protein
MPLLPSRFFSTFFLTVCSCLHILRSDSLQNSKATFSTHSKRAFYRPNDNWAVLLLETFFLVTQWPRMTWALRRKW